MHMPDGILPPTQALIYIIIAAVIVIISIWQSRKSLTLKQIPIVGVLGAALFAAQMFNFPVPFGSSGHLIGTALATALVGPWVGIILLTAILIIQAFIGDGGLLALGANTLNMAIVGAFVTFLLFMIIPKKWRQKKGLYAIFAGVAGFISTISMALFAAAELAIAETSQLGLTFGWMIGLHAIIGLAEAVITTAIVFFVFKADSSLLRAAEDSLFLKATLQKDKSQPPVYHFPVWGLVTSVGVFGIMSIFGIVASTNPDGLERTLERLNISGIESGFGFFGFPDGLGWDILQMAIIMSLILVAIIAISGIVYGFQVRQYNRNKDIATEDENQNTLDELEIENNIPSTKKSEDNCFELI
ncbi:MAG: energy-coupling factor ABC transporter permease [Asgard group archaeon]|nr:energy-coupling factor ABC transporter permease [Asgard group archaeon]